MKNIYIYIYHRLRFVVVGVECGDGGCDVLACRVRFLFGEVSGVLGLEPTPETVCNFNLRPAVDGGSRQSLQQQRLVYYYTDLYFSQFFL